MRRGRSLEARLAHLEDQTQLNAPPTQRDRLDEDDWLAAFEEWGRQGMFDAEPDFPIALAFLRGALTRAHASNDPTYDPPADFCPFEKPHLRLEYWRGKERFPDVCNGLTWLFEFHCRVSDGVPPVTEVEFRQLAEWFHANETRLSGLARSELLDVGGGRQTACFNIRHRLEHGPRELGAGEVAEDIRQLKARYPENRTV
jgi:hypothetical protein